ncbi:hypothetical protein K474DRAFT_1773198 [Panus rudis PR-1116 ss-1]|nr:hypothetical protein K474DRAFT_1773198 [Panus rudis PR-1116 ss-1]
MHPRASCTTRPSLPPLHTLELPTLPRAQAKLAPLTNIDNVPLKTFDEIMSRCRPRQYSNSSTMTAASSCTPPHSRSPSPSDESPTTISSRPYDRHPPAVPSGNFTLIKSSIEEATAFVIVPPCPENTRTADSFLVVGHQAIRLRQKAKEMSSSTGKPRARFHPYKVVRYSDSRRTSLVSERSTSPKEP